MGFQEAVATCFENYATFSGRAKRPEMWWFMLFGFLGVLGLGVLDVLIFGPQGGPAPLAGVFYLVIFLPTLAVQWRRLHDLGKPGYYALTPLLGGVVAIVGLAIGSPDIETVGSGLSFILSILLLVLYASRGQEGPNAYGVEPVS